jgi:hypothetical protein
MYLQKVISRKTYKKRFFVGVLKVIDEIAATGCISQGRGSGSVPKCHGSATLYKTVSVECFFSSRKSDPKPDLITSDLDPSDFVALKKPTF